MRELRDDEKYLIMCLLKNTELSEVDLNSIKVEEMSDGGMGSLYFFHIGKTKNQRHMGKCISERQFFDSDGTPILVSLNVDKDGDLLELDIWKADFSLVIKFPTC